MDQITRLFDILDLYRNKYQTKPCALGRKENGKWREYSAIEYVESVDTISCALLNLGLKIGDTIASISGNSPEWNILDMALAQIGVIHVPIYPTLSAEEIQFIINHAEIKFIFVADKIILDKINKIVDRCTTVQSIYSFQKTSNAKEWISLVKQGKIVEAKFTKQLAKIKDSIDPEDVFSIIYTSGTTGTPKGVMLTHANILSNTLACAKMFSSGPRGMGVDHIALSFLPLCHVYERMMNYTFQVCGLSIYYAEGIGAIAQNISELQPHVFNTVPRLLERVYDKVLGAGNGLTGMKKHLFDKAVEFTQHYEIGIEYSLKQKLQFAIYDKLIYSKWRAALGGRIHYMVSGGSALQIKIHKFFWAAGMRVYEGYGLTETSPVIAVNDPTDDSRVKLGTVGVTIPNGTEMQLAEDGEIITRGPGVMKGYYKAPDLYKEVVDKNGWFHTGDIGVLEDGKYLRITDRKKEIFKLSSGKYVAPQAVENILKGGKFIEQAFVVGENEKFASAVVVPDFDYVKHWCKSENIEFSSKDLILSNEMFLKAIRGEVRELNAKLSSVEQIKRFKIVADEWNSSNGILSATLKLKRKVLKEKYSDLITSIYE